MYVMFDAYLDFIMDWCLMLYFVSDIFMVVFHMENYHLIALSIVLALWCYGVKNGMIIFQLKPMKDFRS